MFEKSIYFSMIFVVVKEISADIVEKQVMEETDLDLKGDQYFIIYYDRGGALEVIWRLG